MLSSIKFVRISAFVSLLLVIVFLTVLLRDEPKLSNPLINMNVEQEIKRNAVYKNSSPIITGIIDKNITKGTYILRGQAIIPENATVTIMPETTIYAERDAQLVVEGKLNATKTTWLSNQAHPSKQYWHGLVTQNNSSTEGETISLSESTISNATAAVTADGGGRIIIKNSVFQNNVASIVTMPNSSAEITDSKIENGDVGIQIIGGSPIIKNVSFKSLYDGLRVSPSSSPRISNISLSLTSHEIIHCLAKQGSTINPPTPNPVDDIAKLIDDCKRSPR